MKTNHLNSGNQDVKLRIIEQLVSIDNNDLLCEIENLIINSHVQPKMKRLTQKELINRAERANLDIKNKLIFSHKEAEENAKTW